MPCDDSTRAVQAEWRACRGKRCRGGSRGGLLNSLAKAPRTLASSQAACRDASPPGAHCWQRQPLWVPPRVLSLPLFHRLQRLLREHHGRSGGGMVVAHATGRGPAHGMSRQRADFVPKVAGAGLVGSWRAGTPVTTPSLSPCGTKARFRANLAHTPPWHPYCESQMLPCGPLSGVGRIQTKVTSICATVPLPTSRARPAPFRRRSRILEILNWARSAGNRGMRTGLWPVETKVQFGLTSHRGAARQRALARPGAGGPAAPQTAG